MQINQAFHDWKPGMHCNSGGPRSRTRTERLQSTVLAKRGGVIRCPVTLPLALDFEGADPVATMYALLEQQGINSPEDLRALFQPLPASTLCRVNPGVLPIKVATASPEEVLKTALMLGLCTAWLYDPVRPVLWTRASLARAVELIDGEGFYAC